jgi:hypothetical protein
MAGTDRRYSPILQPYPPRRKTPFAQAALSNRSEAHTHLTNAETLVDAGPLFPIGPEPYLNSLN